MCGACSSCRWDGHRSWAHSRYPEFCVPCTTGTLIASTTYMISLEVIDGDTAEQYAPRRGRFILGIGNNARGATVTIAAVIRAAGGARALRLLALGACAHNSMRSCLPLCSTRKQMRNKSTEETTTTDVPLSSSPMRARFDIMCTSVCTMQRHRCKVLPIDCRPSVSPVRLTTLPGSGECKDKNGGRYTARPARKASNQLR